MLPEFLILLALAGAPPAVSDSDLVDAMSREHAADTTAPSPAAGMAPARPVHAEAVRYAGASAPAAEGWLARPADADRPRGALIVIHEWWGLNDNIRAMTERLAGEGYFALAVDLYGGQTADSPAEARALMQATMAARPDAVANIRAAYDYLAGELGAEQVASIGWCFGGGWSLETALMFPDELDAAVIYYGRVVTDRERLAGLDVPLLGLFAAEDRGIPVESVRAFESTLAALDKEGEIVVYDDTDHAFANPTGVRYDPVAAADAWRRTKRFLAEHLDPVSPPAR